MNQQIIHVYLMPGMAANPSIFENIRLSSEQFEIHWLEWMIPFPKETLQEYAKRMSEKVVHDDAVLLGVSFGGILVQEMSAFLNLRKLIIASSVKTRYELPRRMKIARITGMYKLAPTRLAQNVDALAKYTFGKTVKRRVELYKKYLSVNDKSYLDWALEQVVCWEREIPDDEVIHIHGEKDMVFPIRYIDNCITVKNGTHIMIINKYKWFNENLPKLILS
ncbi:alpha/beta hydrolase [Flavobacteriaceae sp. LMIT009]